MSDRNSWKMLHLLYTLRPGVVGLTAQQLAVSGVDCGPDTIQPLVDAKAVDVDASGLHSLTQPTRKIMQCCVLGNRRWSGSDMRVDYPEVFVIMPFGQNWSQSVYDTMIRPAVEGVNLRCVRGDTPPRVGDLSQTIWNAVMRAGLIIAEVSASNPNVFYEIGLAHALGKDCFILKQTDATVPADFGGSHFYEYDPGDLDAGKTMLQKEIQEWARDNYVEGVRTIA